MREDCDIGVVEIVRVWGFETESGDVEEVCEDGLFEGRRERERGIELRE